MPHNPEPAYKAKPGTILDVDRAFYTRIAKSADKPGGRTLVEQFVLPIRSGKAWKVAKGQICRITTPEGPQVGDLNLWNLHNPRERFWAARTRQLQSAHVTTFDRLWSNLPYLRPMVTVTKDSLAAYGVDEGGGRVHDLLGTRCDPYVAQMLTGEDFDFHCHSNLVRAVLPHGLTEFDVHDVLNVFQVTGLNQDDRYYMNTCPAKPGDYFEFFAEMDLLCALSTCPGGDLSAWTFEQNRSENVDMVDTCRPLGVEVYECSDRSLLEHWKPPEAARYRGLHGITLPSFAAKGEGRDRQAASPQWI
ncbi:MAG: hypothetical protein M1837_003943 [Sclerophora amabilis]|nr:MAG: hypothetical protein M1837_003943 [Sclerophora amabilis]